MAYKVGDKFIIEIAEEFTGKCWCECPDLLYRIQGFNSLVFDENGLNILEKHEESSFTQEDCDRARQEGYEEGLKDAWEAARKIAASVLKGGLSGEELIDIFNSATFGGIFAENTAAEAISKIKAYEEQKKAEEEGVTTFEKIGEYVRDGVRYFTFNCQKCGRLTSYRFLEDGKYANYCDQCGNRIVNMPFFDSECEINEAEEEIKVGDEVLPLEPREDVVIVTKIWRDDYDRPCIETINRSGRMWNYFEKDVHKTGRHFDIEEILKAMMEE